MKSESFFHFVHSLTKKERAAFTRHTKNSKKYLDVILFERILKEKVFSIEAEARIRGEEFKTGKKYFFYRIKLGRKILLTLVLLEGKDISSYALIKKAIEKHAHELANKMVVNELEELNKAEDFVGIKHMLEFCKELGYRNRISLDLGDFNNRLSEFEAKTERIAYLRSLLEGIRQSFLLNDEEKFRRTQTLDRDIHNFVPTCPSEEYLHLKAEVGLNILRRKYLECFRLQKQIVDLISLKYAIISEVMLIQEWSQLIQFGLQIGDRDYVLEQIFNLKQLELKEEAGKTALLKHLVILQVEFGEQYGNLQLVRNAITIIAQNKHLFDPAERIRRYFISALAYTYNSEHGAALELLESVQAIPYKHRAYITWEPDAVKLLVILEIGRVDEFESAYRRAYRSAAKVGSKYPLMVVSVLKAYSSMDKPSFIQYLKGRLSEVQSAIYKPCEIQTSRVWDFTLWMKSKIYSRSYYEVILQERKKEGLRRSKVNFA